MSAEYYSCHDVEHLTHDDVDDAVDAELDSLSPSDWPTELVVMGYVECDPADIDDMPDLDGLTPMVHDEADDITVDVAAWITEHRPEWLADADVQAWLLAHGDAE